MISCESDFLSSTVLTMLQKEWPPRLQALLRMIQNKLKHIVKTYGQSPLQMMEHSQAQHLLDQLVELSEVLALLMAHEHADVRKSVVFCLVEIHCVVMDDQIFSEGFLAKLNQSQQKLVDIYVQRKKAIDQQ